MTVCSCKIRMPAKYAELSADEIEYDGGFLGGLWKGITDTVGGALGGVTDFFGGLYGGMTDFFGGLWGGLTDFMGGVWGGFLGLIGFGMDDQYAQMRNGWGSQSFFNDLGQFRTGISRYISNPMKYQ